MVKKRVLIRSIAVSVVVILLVAVCGRESRSLRQVRHTKLQRVGASYSADVPPMITFVNVALGGFRGVIADMLWLRVSKLQEERRFVELVQLSDWITKLEPHLADVWVFHAWNMAYNVSVLMSRPEDKWRWVENGFELLRDEGVPLNPRNATLCRELGWIFQHKMGMDGDSAVSYYRKEWAREISAYLEDGGKRPGDDTLMASELFEWMKMDTAAMADLEERFGTIDWRLPDAQSLYWGMRGLENARTNEQLPCRRMIYTSLIEMARRNGKLVGDPLVEGYVFQAVPNTPLIDSTVAFLEETMAKHAFSGIRYAYVGFLRDAMRIRMMEKREAEARALYDKLVAFFSGKTDQKLPPFEQTLAAEDSVFEKMLLSAGFR